MAHLQGGGRRDSSIVRIPEELVEAGLIRQYQKLPFQVCLPQWSVGCRHTTAGQATSRAGPCTSACCLPAGTHRHCSNRSLYCFAAAVQEYYEVLHSCLAVVPAFANDAYYVNKVGKQHGA